MLNEDFPIRIEYRDVDFDEGASRQRWSEILPGKEEEIEALIVAISQLDDIRSIYSNPEDYAKSIVSKLFAGVVYEYEQELKTFPSVTECCALFLQQNDSFIRLQAKGDSEQRIPGNDETKNVLVNLCYLGIGYAHNPEKAFRLYKHIDEKCDNANIQFNLGIGYETGYGTQVDEDKAVAYFSKAAEKGHREAEFKTLCYDRQRGKGGINDHMMKFSELSARGCVKSMKMLKAEYNASLNTVGITPKIIKDIRMKSFNSLSKAANKGDLLSQYDLGKQFKQEGKHHGAFTWFKEAAEAGHVDAQVELGKCYLDASFIEYNPAKAIALYKSALSQKHNNTDAMSALGEMLIEGKHVEQNIQLGCDFLKKAQEIRPRRGCSLSKEDSPFSNMLYKNLGSDIDNRADNEKTLLEDAAIRLNVTAAKKLVQCGASIFPKTDVKKADDADVSDSNDALAKNPLTIFAINNKNGIVCDIIKSEIQSIKNGTRTVNDLDETLFYIDSAGENGVSLANKGKGIGSLIDEEDLQYIKNNLPKSRARIEDDYSNKPKTFTTKVVSQFRSLFKKSEPAQSDSTKEGAYQGTERLLTPSAPAPDAQDTQLKKESQEGTERLLLPSAPPPESQYISSNDEIQQGGNIMPSAPPSESQDISSNYEIQQSDNIIPVAMLVKESNVNSNQEPAVATLITDDEVGDNLVVYATVLPDFPAVPEHDILNSSNRTSSVVNAITLPDAPEHDILNPPNPTPNRNTNIAESRRLSAVEESVLQPGN